MRRRAYTGEKLLAQETDGMTRAEIAAEMGISMERVRQIEKVALRKMREAFAARGVSITDVLEIRRCLM